MLAADAMRLPQIIQGGFFTDEPVATFSTTPGTDNLHNHLSWLTVLDRYLQQESRRHTYMATEKKSKGKFDLELKDPASCCI
jgi:hypothetical protein